VSLLERVRATGLLAPGRPVVVLLSGGRDSTCLLDLAVRIGGEVSALHVNYGLRDAAEDDERHCRELCERLGARLAVRRPRPPERGNLQAWAREVRYAEATTLALAGDADVAAGHTLTDQVETILYRLASSPSRRALYGMAAREGRLVRPLLEVTREQTAAYCRERGLPWREDETNRSRAYARGRVRGELVPALRAVHPGAEHNLLALAQILREEGAVLDALVDQVLAAPVTVARLRALPGALQRLVVQRLADAAAGGLAPGAARRAAEVAALSERGTVELDIGNGLRAVAEYGALRFEPIDGRGDRPPDPVRLSIPGRVDFGEYEVVCELGAPVRETGVLDRGLLGPGLVVRGWRPGDRMAPLGLGGTKTLQDLFTARRVPRAQRASVPVVEAQGEIAWVAGVATSERFKVTERTELAVRLGCAKRRHGASASEPS
jgi:tRNA(Ile)-lysidine synthase